MLDCCQRDIPTEDKRCVQAVVVGGKFADRIMYMCVGVGAALGQLGWWSGTFLMGEIGPILLSSPLRTSGTFYLFSGMCLLAFLHVLLLIPETKVSENQACLS